jgi:hypothetical protein
LNRQAQGCKLRLIPKFCYKKAKPTVATIPKRETLTLSSFVFSSCTVQIPNPMKAIDAAKEIASKAQL